MMTTLKTTKLNRKNKLILVEKDGTFKVVSLKLTWLGWRKSDYALNYQTNLTGKKIIGGDYQSFKLESLATKWMDFLSTKFSKRVSFVS